MHYKRRRVWLEEYHAGRTVDAKATPMPPLDVSPYKLLPEALREHREPHNTNAPQAPVIIDPAAPDTPHAPASYGAYPTEIFLAFQRDILEKADTDWGGQGRPPKSIALSRCTLKQAQRFFSDTNITVFELVMTPKVLYDWIADKALSPSYTTKLLRLINRFGQYVAFHHNPERRQYFSIKAPTGKSRQRIREASQGPLGGACLSVPLTRHMLAQSKKRLTPPEYNWMYVSFYLGLRPSEVDALAKAGESALVERQGLKWLKVFQSKLVHLPPERRWKAIPLLYPSQKKAASLALSGDLKRPNVAKLKRIFKGRQVTTYAGRKGYASMMLGKGVPFAAISKLLGHKSEKLTRAVYSDPFEVQMAELSNLFGKKEDDK